MLTIIHVVASVINALLHDVANLFLKAGGILFAALAILVLAGTGLGLSGFGAATFLKRRSK